MATSQPLACVAQKFARASGIGPSVIHGSIVPSARPSGSVTTGSDALPLPPEHAATATSAHAPASTTSARIYRPWPQPAQNFAPGELRVWHLAQTATAAAACRLVPQLLQNFAPGVTEVLHLGQVAVMAVPQCAQNFASALLVAWQLGHSCVGPASGRFIA